MDETITKKQAIEAITDELDRIDHVPKWIFDRLERAIRKLPSAESESFEWCTDCKEYDQESHCCHRYSKMIRKTVEEMQIQIAHCIDCRHSEYDSVYSERWCHYNGKAEVVDDYHFCRDGERREDG